MIMDINMRNTLEKVVLVAGTAITLVRNHLQSKCIFQKDQDIR